MADARLPEDERRASLATRKLQEDINHITNLDNDIFGTDDTAERAKELERLRGQNKNIQIQLDERGERITRLHRERDLWVELFRKEAKARPKIFAMQV